MNQACGPIILRRVFSAGLLCLLAWMSLGCTTSKSAGVAESLDAVSFEPVEQSVDAIALLGPYLRNESFVVTAGLLTGKQWQFSHTQGPAVNEHILLFEAQHRSLLKVNLDQSVMLLEEDDYVQQVKVIYDPPIMVIPANLSHGQPQTHVSKMTVYTLNGKTKRDQGTCTVTLEVLGRQTLNTPAGIFNPIVFKTTRQLKLGLAKGTVTIFDYYVPHIGLVAHRVDRKLITMGFIPMNSVTEVQRAQSNPKP